MKKIFKRLLSVMLALVMVVGMIPVSAVPTKAAVTVPKGTTIYFDPSPTWETANAAFGFVSTANMTNSDLVVMQQIENTGIYKGTLLADATNISFRRLNPANTSEVWNAQSNWPEFSSGEYLYTLSDGAYNDATGEWSAYSESGSGESGGDSGSDSNVIYLHATIGTAPFKANFSGDGSITAVNMVKVADGYYRATIPASTKTTVMFVDAEGKWLANGSNWPTLPSDGSNCFEPAGFGANGWSWSTYSTGSGTTTTETFMVSTELWDYFNNTRVGSGDNGSTYRSDNQGDETGGDQAPYSAWNYVIAGNSTTDTSNRPTTPLYFGGLGHQSNRKMEEINGNTWTKHGLPNFSLTANVALSDYGNAAAQGIVAKQLVNGNLADPKGFELPYFKTGALYNGSKQVSAYYSDLQFPFKKVTNASGQTMYSYDSATDYAVYYSYSNKNLYTSTNAYSRNTTRLSGAAENEKGYYPFDEANGYDPSAYVANVSEYNKTAANKRNMGFGTRFTIPFTLSMDENRQINGQDIVFNFTGDDDVWVFIDDVLVLDMGGAHYKASGEINFTKETVTVTQAFPAQNSTSWTDGTIEGDTWDQLSSLTAGVTVAEDVDKFENITGVFAGEMTSKSLADLFSEDDTKVHTLTFFYMERGMYDSNMSISFTFNPVPSGLILSKAVNTANVNAGLASTVQTQDYFDFKIEREETVDSTASYVAQSDIAFTKEFDGEGNESGATTSEGVVKNLADNIYAYDFMRTNSSGSKEDAFKLGDKLKVTEVNVDSDKYSTSVFVWDQTNAEMVTLLDDTKAGTTSAAFQLGEADASNPNKPGVNYVVNFTNTPYVGSVSVEKAWSTGTAPAGTKFDFKVLVDLDGEGTAYDYQPYALDYTINGTSGTTGTDGTLQLAAGEKAVFAGIPVGAKVKAAETTTSGDGWVVDGANEKEVTIANGTTADITITNKASTGSVSLTKAWGAGTAPADTTYEFEVLVDQDGDGTAYDYAESALDYTSDNGTTGKLSSGGKVQLKAGETITFAGLPAGAKVKATETTTSGDTWEVDGAESGEVTVESGKTLNITITNKSKLNLDKVIYIEARENTTANPDAGTTYTVKDSSDAVDNNKVTVTTLVTEDLPEGTTATTNSDGSVTYKTGTDDTGITVSVSDGSVVLKTENAGKEYVIPYTGTKDGTNVYGKITVFTYKATQKVYVFDYGLESDLAAINTNGDGLFEGGVFYNTNAIGTNATTATFSGVTGVDNVQTKIEASAATVAINEDGSANGSVTFTPVAFMSAVENYTYTADIVKKDTTFDSTDPETGTVVNGKIKVMPASVVYYEDNFNSDSTSTDSTAKIIYSGTTATEGTSLTLTQSNGQTEQYGYDTAYTDGTADSAGSSTKLTADGYNTKAVFTFTGTGFDVVARTTTTTAGIVYTIEKYDETADAYSFHRMGAVDTYYANGDLYQIPVIHEDLDYGTYRVTLGIKQTGDIFTMIDENGDEITVDTRKYVVYLDGIRIYNPLGTSGNTEYIDNEENVTFEKVSDLILGSGEITETGIVDEDGVSVITGQSIKDSRAAMVGNDFENDYVTVLGYTKTEDTSEGAEGSNQTDSILQYMHSGPNNEIYVDDSASIAFVAEGIISDTSTLQIEAKLVNIDGGQKVTSAGVDLNVWNGSDLVKVDTVKSSTAMYYKIDLNNCIKIGTDKYLVVISGNSDAADENGTCSLAFSNLKYKGYTLANPLDDAYKDVVANYIDKSYLGDETAFVDYSGTYTIRKGQWINYKYAVTLSKDVFEGGDPEFTMYYVNNGTKTKITVTAQRDEESECKYKLKFKAPGSVGTFPIEIRYVVDGEESAEYYATSMKVNR